MSDVGESPRGMTINQACRALTVSRATLYRMHADDEIVFRKLRKRTVVPSTEVARILAVRLGGESLEGERAPVREPVREPKIRRVKKLKLYSRVR